MDWQEKAKRLPFEQRRKIPHCTSNAEAYISNNAKGVSLYCFRCGTTEFKHHGRLSAAEVLAMRKRDAEVLAREMPRGRALSDPDTPADARVWVMRAGINPETATERYGIVWDSKSSRVILPVLHDSKRTGQFTARAVDGRKPKYLTPRGSFGATWVSSKGSGSPVIVVEDILSAIKCTEAGYSAVCVLGTNVSAAQASMLSDREVLGWFDGDAAGRKGFFNLRKALGPHGVVPRRIQTPNDPKTYQTHEIQEILG